jgi:hypothetical protein
MAALHQDQELCAQLLGTVVATIPLQISQSKISGAGTGLFVTQAVKAGEEVFRSDPLVSCVEDGMQSKICELCYRWPTSRVLPHGRFCAAEDNVSDPKACSGCKVCYYCSKVGLWL